ncbi:hypothetical protein FGD67_08145 [Colwellia sp. M166]|mgnify:CR=1 FL=1|uniref:hypothetical protein n=1 Tax=Colwellia sp. M166 TaxID=2583805 RepID=UPI00211EEC89|nr:hypothetical protein [Colwellia sp. M166]UUO23185.1 hypothetical protein FGD67_08145 [Colwellia sp. M166]|tara:strand:+ start:61 stop:780 length:720 start_codon:yes stop_codon:yes gene_type:complete
MSNKDELSQEQAFANWLDGKSDDCQFDDGDLAHETLWQQRKNTVNAIEQQVSMSGEQSVPAWDRASAFSNDKVTFWQWRGLPVLSMAFSILAVALVLFNVELVIQDKAIVLSFAGANSQLQDEEIAKLVDMKLQGFALQQQVLLANYAADIKVKQQDNNLQLASYIMGVSRQERKEDISDFIQYINAERKDELLEQKIKYQALEQAIKYHKTYQRNDVKGYGLKPGDIKSTPADWTAEE